MQKIDQISAMHLAAGALQRGGQRLALIPTLGALHAGHVSLMKLAREKADTVIVSALVNPLQFGPSEDFARYPRSPAADAALSEKAGVDIFLPRPRRKCFREDFLLTFKKRRSVSHCVGRCGPPYFVGS